jgi:hypothetical protein
MLPHTVRINKSATLVSRSWMSMHSIPLLLFFDDDISLVCVPDELSTVMSGVVSDGPDFPEDLERHNPRNLSFIESHLLDGPHVSSSVHSTQRRIAVSHKATFLHFHVSQVFAVWGACLAGACDNVQVII